MIKWRISPVDGVQTGNAPIQNYRADQLHLDTSSRFFVFQVLTLGNKRRETSVGIGWGQLMLGCYVHSKLGQLYTPEAHHNICVYVWVESF